MLTAPGAWEGYASLVPEGSNFRNEICPRIMLMKQAPTAMSRAEEVQCPVLILVCEKDELVAQDSHVKVTEILGTKAQVIEYPIGHFDIYKGENFEKAVKEQIYFVKNIIKI